MLGSPSASPLSLVPALTAPGKVCNHAEFVTQPVSTVNNSLCPLPSQEMRTAWQVCGSVCGLSATRGYLL